MVADASPGDITDVSIRNTGFSINSQVAIPGGDNNRVYVVWQDLSDGDFDILFAKSEDGGITYSSTIEENVHAPINLSEDLQGASENPQIISSSDGAFVYVVWEDDSDGNRDIYFAVSENGGDSFSEPQNISKTDFGSNSAPKLVLNDEGTKIYVVWSYATSNTESDIYFALSANGGELFSNPKDISQTEGSLSANPEIIISLNQTIYVTWQDSADGDNDIYFSASVTDGALFSSPPYDVSANTGNSENPKLALAGNITIYLVWEDISSGNNEVLFAKSSDAGSSFSGPVDISQTGDSGVSSDAVIAVSGIGDSNDRVFIGWSDNAGLESGRDIYMVQSNDAASSFSLSENVSDNPRSSLSPKIYLADDGQVILLWSDNFPDADNDEILLSVNNESDNSFGCPINISGNPTSSSSPDLSLTNSSGIDGLAAFVSWQDLVDFGNMDILVRNKLNFAEPHVSINDPVVNSTPQWGIDDVEISGILSNFNSLTDSIVIDWGDGTESEAPVEGCSWGPVTHQYAKEEAIEELNPHQIVVKLIENGNPVPIAISDEREVTVEKHSTLLQLDFIPAVKAGSEFTVTGLLTDSESGDPIPNELISFVGSGAEQGNLEQIATDSNGVFSMAGVAPSLAQDNLEVTAIFDGSDSYDSALSMTRTFDVADENAEQFSVDEGENSIVHLEGFGASIGFDHVIGDGGVIYVSTCISASSDRFVSLDSCINVSPGVQLDDGTGATIIMSYDPADIPPQYSEDQISIFHKQLAGDGSGNTVLVDITTDRDPILSTVSGRTSTFSEFILGLSLHPDAQDQPGVHRREIFVGNGQVISLRDITNLENSTKFVTGSFNKERYELDDRPIITVVDSNGNVDSSKVDVMTIGVRSETSDPDIIGVLLTETDKNTGIFRGSFGLTTSESSTEDGVLEVGISTDGFRVIQLSGARFQATFDGVTESGIIELSDYIVEEDACFKPIGGAVDLRIVDAQVSQETGLVTVLLSYANANFRGFDPSQFRLMQRIEGEWTDITIDNPNPELPLVAGATLFSGPLSIAVDPNDCGGSAGGGLGRPGTGLVVDAVVSITRGSSGGQTDGNTNAGGNGNGRTAFSTIYSTSYFEAHPLTKFTVDLITAASSDGVPVPLSTGSTMVGEPIGIGGTISNHQQTSQDYAWIVQLMSQDSVVRYIYYEEGSLRTGETKTLAASPWVPAESGEYEVKVLIWSHLGSKPIVLSEVGLGEIIVK